MTWFGIFVMDTYYVLNSTEDATSFTRNSSGDARQDAKKDVQKTARGYTEVISQEEISQREVAL
jgi:hypothetical protein